MHQIFNYENASELNPKLYEIISEYKGKPVVGGGCKTTIHLHKEGIEELTTLLEWIEGLVPLVSHRCSNPSNDKFNHIDYLPPSDYGGGKYNFNINAFKLVHCWGVTYDKGDGVEMHNHFPYALSFCYYVNLPSGSSPLVLNNEIVNPKAGQVVFFLSSAYHSVPACSVDGRCSVVGNIMYIDKSYIRV